MNSEAITCFVSLFAMDPVGVGEWSFFESIDGSQF